MPYQRHPLPQLLLSPSAPSGSAAPARPLPHPRPPRGRTASNWTDYWSETGLYQRTSTFPIIHSFSEVYLLTPGTHPAPFPASLVPRSLTSRPSSLVLGVSACSVPPPPSLLHPSPPHPLSSPHPADLLFTDLDQIQSRPSLALTWLCTPCVCCSFKWGPSPPGKNQA